MTDGAICNMINEIKMIDRPCPNCGNLTYLGVMIPTVEAHIADYYPTSFVCLNPSCRAYWSSDDKYYYTPENPRDEY
ncbi:hypothetical protein [Methanobacterium spitsbergense]|uniref:Uncharacterized protein n=1 Tax=Methanobacterium spitsbergense TaxID=2874285 RepID=A0A8T5V3C4_9EURY|nr:hypothetical protein [Methanobacterium spitsbergense]MBZ2166361.1 hypothetical protein [Methanobacterium spitsbergense]